jgi:predicted NBD/HSP70 family sugar kinase/biotin operon repressor
MSQIEGRSNRQLRTQRLLLDTVAETGSVTREELGRLTGLSRSAVAAAVQALLADGHLVERVAQNGSGRKPGRPSARLTIAQPDGPVVGIDFGHTHVRAAVADGTGKLISERSDEVDVDNKPTLALDTAATIVATCLSELNLRADEISAVAACIPGPLDLTSDAVRSPTILADWTSVNAGDELADRLGRPVTVDNDANSGALGELYFGVARDYRDFLYLKASHGIGAGLVLNGEVYRGSAGIAGEIGHTQLPGATNLCRCGSRGCLETVLTITEIRRQLDHVIGLPASAASLAELSAQPAAGRVLNEAGRTLGRVLADLCNCLNPAAVVIGGELGTVGEPLLTGVRESIDRYAQPATAATLTIHAATLGPKAELMGAIATALRQARSKP